MQNITNPFFGKQEGFGEQYKQIIFYMAYAEMHNKNFVYSPFKEVAHNYTNDPNWITDLENFIGIRDKITTIADQEPSKEQPFVADVLHGIHNNMHKFKDSSALRFIRNSFYERNPDAKQRPKTTVAVHIRRPNPDDNVTHSGLMVPDSIYVQIISRLHEMHPRAKICIYSQGEPNNFNQFSEVAPTQIELHINESLKETFLGLVYADILIVAPSALSYVAGLLCPNSVYYIHHCNPPLPGWKMVENYVSPRLYHKFGHLTTIYFDSEKGEYILFKDSFNFKPLRIV